MSEIIEYRAAASQLKKIGSYKILCYEKTFRSTQILVKKNEGTKNFASKNVLDPHRMMLVENKLGLYWAKLRLNWNWH